MSRYSARIRALENRIAPACPLCAGYPAIDFVTVHGAETPPPAPPPCEACGKLATRFIVHHAADEVEVSTRVEKGSAADAVAPSEQPAAAALSRRAPVAQSVPAAHDNNARAETAPKPRTRRRRYCGPE